MANSLQYGEHFFVLIVSTISLSLHGHLLLKCASKAFKGRLSANLLINIVCFCIVGFAGLVMGAYISYNWTQESGIHSGYAIFWTGTMFYTTTAMVSTSVGFLMIDRILVVMLPTSFRKHKTFFNVLNIVTVLAVGTFVLLSLVILELPVDELTACPGIWCVVTRNKGLSVIITKLFLGTPNFIIAIFFAGLIFRYNKTSLFSQKNFKRTNSAAIVACTTEFLFNLLPNAFYVYNYVTGFDQWKAYGPYPAVCSSLDAFFAALVYRKLILKNPSVVHVAPSKLNRICQKITRSFVSSQVSTVTRITSHRDTTRNDTTRHENNQQQF